MCLLFYFFYFFKLNKVKSTRRERNAQSMVSVYHFEINEFESETAEVATVRHSVGPKDP